MRKLLAFLKDSYREAVSGWVLQAMLVLIGLFLLLVLSTSFRQLTLQQVLDGQFGFINTFVGSNPQLGSPKITVENAVESNPVEPWSSGHSFDIVVTCPTPADYEKAKKSGLPVDKAAMSRMMKSIKLFEGLTVEEVTTPPPAPKGDEKPDEKASAGPAVARFHITATGTTITERREWPHQLVVFFAVPVTTFLSFSPRDGAYLAENYLVSGIGGWIFCLLAVVITAAFIPNMMAKGALDLIVSKPVSRVGLLVCKYLGGLTFMVLLTSFAVVGVYLMVGVRTGIWAPHFLAAIPLLTLQFAILYAVSTLIGTLTRNSLVAILGTLLAWFLLFAFGAIDNRIHEREKENDKLSEMLRTGRFEDFDEMGRPQSREELIARMDPNRPLWSIIPAASFPVWKAVNLVLPRMTQIDDRAGRLIAQGVLTDRQQKARGWDQPARESWAELIGVTGLFIAVILGLASWRFVTRDG